jgi:exodeoxyribonuclease-5
MLPNDLWELLLRHKKHIIALGDPFQIPPIDKKADNHILDHPHVFLDQIMRQAEESEIIRLTMAIREGKPIDYFKGSEVQVLRPGEVVEGMYHWAD